MAGVATGAFDGLELNATAGWAAVPVGPTIMLFLLVGNDALWSGTTGTVTGTTATGNEDVADPLAGVVAALTGQTVVYNA